MFWGDFGLLMNINFQSNYRNYEDEEAKKEWAFQF